MKVIDSHVHLGGSRTASISIPEETWLEVMERYKVDGVCVLPLPDPYPDSKTVHDRIYKFTQDHLGHAWGIADINPRCEEDEYIAEATRCVKELGFVALKLHPFLEATNPRGKHAVKVYETARALNVPILVHTGQGAPMALPTMMIPIAKKYPDVRFVLSHAGAFVYFDEAMIAAQFCDNIYLETSWCGAGQILSAINTLGADRVLFGSDGNLEVGPAIAKAEAINLPEDKFEKYMGQNAIDLFGLKF